jgi:hypothetical protein
MISGSRAFYMCTMPRTTAGAALNRQVSESLQTGVCNTIQEHWRRGDMDLNYRILSELCSLPCDELMDTKEAIS